MKHPQEPAKKAGRAKPAKLIDDQDPRTTIKYLRKRYGAGLAPDWDGNRTLGELLSETGFASLTQYVKHSGRRRPGNAERTEPAK